MIYKFPQTGKEKPGKNSLLAVSTRRKPTMNSPFVNKELEDALTMLKLKRPLVLTT